MQGPASDPDITHSIHHATRPALQGRLHALAVDLDHASHEDEARRQGAHEQQKEDHPEPR